MTPKIGYLLPTREQIMEGRPEAKPLLDLAARAEAEGFDSVWVGDSLTARPRHDPLTLLAGEQGVLGIFAAIGIRLFTDLATPGWATSVVGNLLVVLVQTVVIVVASSLMLLAGRSNRQIVPAVDAAAYVAQTTCVALPDRHC